jgi:hypothetical protein
MEDDNNLDGSDAQRWMAEQTRLLDGVGDEISDGAQSHSTQSCGSPHRDRVNVEHLWPGEGLKGMVEMQGMAERPHAEKG